MLDELLENYDLTEPEIQEHCSGVCMLELTLAEFQRQMQAPYFNQTVSVPERMRTLPKLLCARDPPTRPLFVKRGWGCPVHKLVVHRKRTCVHTHT